MKNQTEVRLELAPSEVRGFSFDEYAKVSEKDLNVLGVSMDESAKSALMNVYGQKYAMDAALQTTPSITNPVQFFQYWEPEAVEIVTSAMKIDDIVGRTIAGSFEEEEIVTRVMERTGSAHPYTDTANIPLSSWNQNFITRSVVRFEEGLEVGYLESLRADRMRVDSHKEKAAAAAQSLAIEHNNIGFYGYANGLNKTYGFLNDPNLPAYQTVAEDDAQNTSWSVKSFNDITADIITAVSALVNQLGGLFDPRKDEFVLSLALQSTQYLNTMNELGTKSVSAWISETYPKCRIESAVQLNGANGGENVMYLHVERVNGKPVVRQYVQDVLRLVGVEKRAKVTVEDYASATAGVVVTQPIGFVRYSGI
jgi:hypothetical protein